MEVKVVLDKRRINKAGKYPLKIRIYNLGKTVYIPLDINVFESEFDEEAGRLFIFDKKSKAEKTVLNNIIARQQEKADLLCLELRRIGQENILPSKFKAMFLSDELNSKITFNDYFRSFIQLKTKRTGEIYESTLSKIESHFNESLFFDDITFSWLEKFDNIMSKEIFYNSKGEIIKKGLEINGRSIHMRNIRAVFNHAIDNDVVPLNLYPFRRYKIKREETVKRSMEIDNLRALFSFDGTESENWARDVGKLIFFLIGINVKDLYYLDKYTGGKVDYKRAKTGRIYQIKIEPETNELLIRFSGVNGLIFSEQFQLYKSFGKRVNKYLADICYKLEIPRITTYSLRHTWATIAAEMEIPKETISEGLGHSSGKSVTDVYIKFNRKKVDEANRKIMNYILYHQI
ncbi:MAG: site-specific integrase [Bacteroides sp.]|nr:site-specific integrase [Bacteroides sp.]